MLRRGDILLRNNDSRISIWRSPVIGGFLNTNFGSANFLSLSTGFFTTAAAFIGISLPFVSSVPSVGYPVRNNPFVAGAFAGRGGAVSVAFGAQSVADLAGNSTVYNLNTPWFALQLSVGTGTQGQPVYTVSAGTGGLGASLSSYTTQTPLTINGSPQINTSSAAFSTPSQTPTYPSLALTAASTSNMLLPNPSPPIGESNLASGGK
jgi:hypothetical protein